MEERLRNKRKKPSVRRLPACLSKEVSCLENKHAGSLRTDGFFRMFRNLSSIFGSLEVDLQRHLNLARVIPL